MQKNYKIGGFKAWSIVLIGSLFYCYQYIIRVSPNATKDLIGIDFGLDQDELGGIIGLYYWGYAAMQIPIGFLLDYIGPRVVIASGCFLCALSSYIFAHTESIIYFKIARVLLGIGASCGFTGTLKIGTLWIPPRKMGYVIIAGLGLGTLGAWIGNTAFGYLVHNYGMWREPLESLAIFGFVFSAIILIFVKNYPNQEVLTKVKKHKFKSPFHGLLKIICSPQIWLLSIFGMLMYIPLTLFGVGWGVSFIRTCYNFNAEEAAFFCATLYLGAALGTPLFNYISDVLYKRKTPLLIGAISALVIWSFVIYLPAMNNYYTLFIIFFLGGVAYTSKTLTFAAVCETVPVSISGLAVGFTNMVVMLSGIAHPLVGKLLVWHSDREVSNQIYTSNDYQFALSIVIVCIIISIVIIPFIRETHPARHIHRGVNTE